MADGGFELTPRQVEAEAILNGPASDILLEGGSRSGKTLLIVRKILQRGLKAPGSRHLISRFRAKHVMSSVLEDTWPKVLRLCWPDLQVHLNKQAGFATLPGGSQVWFAGLDDGDRVEKILGMEFASVFFNECSQIPWATREMVKTRLAQQVLNRATGRWLRVKAYHDCNPPSKAHWTYRVWHQGVDPETKEDLQNRELFAHFKINPRDNERNLSPEYMRILEGMSPRRRKRFLDGEYADANPNALFQEDLIDRYRELDDLPDMLRLVIGVDPSGADDDDGQGEHDEVGIIVAGLGVDGCGYILEDLTVNAGPATWGRVVAQAFDRLNADRVVGEVNFGGGMVGYVIRTAHPKAPFTKLTASRGKVVRAEPVSALFEDGRCRLAGNFPELEDELYGFTTHGYIGDHSPNRADAAIWALTYLFPELTKPEANTPPPRSERTRRGSWMENL